MAHSSNNLPDNSVSTEDSHGNNYRNFKADADKDTSFLTSLTNKRPVFENLSFWSVFKRSARYEFNFLRYHPWDYALILWLPLLTILGVWWTFSKPFIVGIPIGIVDQSRSSYSQTLTRYLETSPDIEVAGAYPSLAEAQTAVLDHKIYGIVVIPRQFADNINRGVPAPIVFKVNAQYGTHSGMAQRGVQTVVGTLSAGVEMQRMVKQGLSTNSVRTLYSPIGVERISLFNAGANYQQFLASTVIPALLHILMMIIGATTVGRELRNRTMGVWYQSITHSPQPLPDFAALQHIPPEEKLDYIQTQDTFAQSLSLAADSNHSHANHANTVDVVINTKADTTEIISENSKTSQVLADNRTDFFTPAHISIKALIAGLNGKFIWAMLAYTLWGALMVTLATWVHPASLSAVLIVFAAFIVFTMLSFWLGAMFCLLSYSLRMGLSTTAFISAPSFAFAGITFPLLAMSDGARRWANTLPLTHYLDIHITQLQMLAPISLAYPTLLWMTVAVGIFLMICTLLSVRALKHPERWGAR